MAEMAAYIGTVFLGLIIMLIFYLVGIALIIGVDRILDMSRTTVNVTGDLTACALMNRWL